MGFVGITEFTNTSKLLWLTVHLMMLLLVEFGNSESLEECCTTHFVQRQSLLNFSFNSCVKKMKDIRQKCDTDETVCKIARQCSVKNLNYDDCASIFQTLFDAEWTVSSIIASLEQIPEPNLNLFQSVTKYERWLWWDDFLDKKFETEFEMYKNIPDIVKNEHYKNKLTTYQKWWKKANKITDEEKNPTDREFSCNYDEVKRLMDFDKNNKLTEEQCIQIFEKICIKKSKLPEELLKKVLSPPNDGDENVEFNTVKIMLSNSKEMSDLLESIGKLSGQTAKIWNYKNSVRMIAKFNEIEAPFKISGMASCISLNLKPDRFTLLWKHAHDKGLPRAVTKAVLEKLSLYKIINNSQEEEEISRKLTIFLVNVSEFYKKFPRKQDGMLNVLFMIKQASQRGWDLEKLNNFISLIPIKLGDDELIPFFQAVDANGNINILSHTIMFFKSFELNNIWRILIENDYTKNVNSFVNLDKDYPVVTPLVLKIILSSKNPGCTQDQVVAIIKDLTKQEMYESDVAVVEKIKSTCPDFVQ